MPIDKPGRRFHRNVNAYFNAGASLFAAYAMAIQRVGEAYLEAGIHP